MADYKPGDRVLVRMTVSTVTAESAGLVLHVDCPDQVVMLLTEAEAEAVAAELAAELDAYNGHGLQFLGYIERGVALQGFKLGVKAVYDQLRTAEPLPAEEAAARP